MLLSCRGSLRDAARYPNARRASELAARLPTIAPLTQLHPLLQRVNINRTRTLGGTLNFGWLSVTSIVVCRITPPGALARLRRDDGPRAKLSGPLLAASMA